MKKDSSIILPVVAITTVWFGISVILTLWLAAANDTLGKDPAVPFWITAAWNIVLFPMSLYGAYTPPPKVLEPYAGGLFFIFVFCNSVLWALFWVFLSRSVLRFFTVNNVEKEKQTNRV